MNVSTTSGAMYSADPTGVWSIGVVVGVCPPTIPLQLLKSKSHIRMGTTCIYAHKRSGYYSNRLAIYQTKVKGYIAPLITSLTSSTLSVLSQRMFSGLRSRCAIPLSWRKARALATSRTTRLASRSVNLSCFWMCANSGPVQVSKWHMHSERACVHTV